ncbi:MAG: prepilin-type N-terminal cleavage/methylation domain-containing protein, partial [Dehalococcoidia bacterium]|nr:prepilin-type N-terminal cleavage/methylation domain-containing protein [Dehalococcoidia bacterium]
GFTLIELLIVMVILAILAGVVIMAVGGVFGTAHESAYDAVKPQLQNGVIEYTTDHNGNLPPVIGDWNQDIVTPLGTVNDTAILDVCAIVGGDRILRTMPDGCALITGIENDNCDGTQPCTGCNEDNHYVWYMDSSGNVYSLCPGTGCTLNGTDGYQGVWP